MSDKKKTAPAELLVPAENKSTTNKGVIVYNANLDAWRCIDKNGKMVLSTGSRAAAQRAFPDFKVKE